MAIRRSTTRSGYAASRWTRRGRTCFSEKGKARSADRHYTTMAAAAIEQLPVGELAARNAHLFLWITGPCLVQGMHLPIMRAWGFEPSAAAFVWIKPKLRRLPTAGSFSTKLCLPKAWATPLAKMPSTWCWAVEASLAGCARTCISSSSSRAGNTPASRMSSTPAFSVLRRPLR